MDKSKIHMVHDITPRFPLCNAGKSNSILAIAYEERDVNCKKCIKIMMSKNKEYNLKEIKNEHLER